MTLRKAQLICTVCLHRYNPIYYIGNNTYLSVCVKCLSKVKWRDDIEI